jgi:FMN reductase
MTPRTIAVVSAGLSQPSSTRLLADQLAAAAARGMPAGTQIVTIELRELAHDVVNNLLTGFPSPALQHAIGQVVGADGLIAVTPLYSGSYNGLFKSFFDVIDPEALAGKPVLIAATGGTARHSLALEHAIRPLFTYLRAGHRAHRGLRRHAGLGLGGQLRQRAHRPHRAGRRRAGRHDRPAPARSRGRSVRIRGAIRAAAPHYVMRARTSWQPARRRQRVAWAPVIMAARSSGCRNEGGGGGPQAKSPRAPSRSSGFHS